MTRALMCSLLDLITKQSTDHYFNVWDHVYSRKLFPIRGKKKEEKDFQVFKENTQEKKKKNKYNIN